MKMHTVNFSILFGYLAASMPEQSMAKQLSKMQD
jgi:hypothetical protein